MLFAATVYHTQSNSFGYASNSVAGAIPVCLEVVPAEQQFQFSGRGFFCVQKEQLNG